MIIKSWSSQKRSLLIGAVVGLILTIAVFAIAEQFNRVGIGAAPSNRGEQLRVKSHAIFGMYGQQPGILTLMPPDGTGFYHIDNPGGQRIRISHGSVPGQHVLMTIHGSGEVTIHGNINVIGEIQKNGQPIQ
jgi:hypothetical protein